jgi:hypothetical protein
MWQMNPIERGFVYALHRLRLTDPAIAISMGADVRTDHYTAVTGVQQMSAD